MNAELAAAAAGLAGTPWRLHGREPETGLDCIGLLAAAMAAIGRPVTLPTGYTLRLRDPDQWIPDPAALGFRPAGPRIAPGDVILLRSGPAQIHLAIASPDRRWVHAHAGLRRVVIQDAMPDGHLFGRWRLIS